MIDVIVYIFFIAIALWLVEKGKLRRKNHKKAGLTLIIIGSILGLLLVLSGIGRLLGASDGTLGHDSPTPATATIADTKAGFIQSCTEDGTAVSTCECAFSVLEKNYTYEQYVSMESDEGKALLDQYHARVGEECSQPAPAS